jgi:hypothetical protein
MLRSNPHAAVSAELPLTSDEVVQVWRTLDDLLQSPPLRATAQCQHLLRYIVEHTLSGDTALLRERVIGADVFGRRADYEPAEDPVVRIRAADLRKRLALYYQSLPHVPELKIDVPSGSYRAVFTWRRDDDSATGPPAPVAVPPPAPVVDRLETRAIEHEPSLEQVPQAAPAPWIRRVTATGPMKWLPLLVFLVLLSTATIAGWVGYMRMSDPVRRFWAPMSAGTKPVIISIGSNAVYRVGDREIDRFIEQSKSSEHDAGQDGMELFPPFRPDQSFASTGLYEAPNSFVALGDVASASEMVQMLTRYDKEFEERFPNDISFAEVREHPTILIGGANNPTTRELTRDVPFVRSGRNFIRDRDHPGRGWELHASSDSHDTEDFAIITRLAATKDASPLVSVAGLGQYGTLAATDFLCRPDNIVALHHALGENWLKRNFQVVLRIKITNFKPVTTVIVDQRLW